MVELICERWSDECIEEVISLKGWDDVGGEIGGSDGIVVIEVKVLNEGG